MPKVIKTTVYEFDELSDAAKEKARDWWRQGEWEDTFWTEATLEDAQRVAALMGITFDEREFKTVSNKTRSEPAVSWSGFWSQGDGASFDGSYRYKKGSVKTVKAYAPQDAELLRIVQALFDVQKKHGYRLRAKCKVRGHYCHSGCMEVEVYDFDDDYRDIGDSEKFVRELLRDFANWIYRQLEAEYEYQNADEQVDDNIRANEYTFTEDGRRKG